MLLEPHTIGPVTFRNRIIRSSMGGRMAEYDGTVTSVWKNFERRFVDGGVGGVISTTFDVNKRRESPPQYPPITDDGFVEPLRRYIGEIQRADCPYIVQIGDPGYQTQTSLFAEAADGKSSSPGFDLIYGYRTRRAAMSDEEIERSIEDFARAARRVRATGAAGLEITASKGYLIHQFLNPGINLRDDAWGGDREQRFQFLRRIVEAVTPELGPSMLFGIRLAAEDYNHLPLNLRWPIRAGNTLDDTLYYGRELAALGVHYLHIDSGYGFIHPRVTPGPFPYDEARIFFDQTRHLSGKASFRAGLLNVVPRFFGRWLFNLGWRYEEGINLDYASTFRREVGLPVIANGGFQRRSTMSRAVEEGHCDLIAVARALLANPDLPHVFAAGRELPERPCSHCNRCAARTATSPLGCYDRARFASDAEMEQQILACNRPDAPPDVPRPARQPS